MEFKRGYPNFVHLHWSRFFLILTHRRQIFWYLGFIPTFWSTLATGLAKSVSSPSATRIWKLGFSEAAKDSVEAVEAEIQSKTHTKIWKTSIILCLTIRQDYCGYSSWANPKTKKYACKSTNSTTHIDKISNWHYWHYRESTWCDLQYQPVCKNHSRFFSFLGKFFKNIPILDNATQYSDLIFAQSQFGQLHFWQIFNAKCAKC